MKMWVVVFLLLANSLSYAQNNNKVALHKYNVYCDIFIPNGWKLYPNNNPSSDIIADLYLPNKYNDIPLIFIAVKTLSAASDIEMNKLINKYNETNVKNGFRISMENNERYKIYSTENHNGYYSSCLYTRYENYCIYIYLETDTIESKINLLKIVIEIADNLNIRIGNN